MTMVRAAAEPASSGSSHPTKRMRSRAVDKSPRVDDVNVGRQI